MAHHQKYERCLMCGKSIIPTWSEAERVARDMMRLSGKTRGAYPYWSRPCQAVHIGKATTKTYKRVRKSA